MGIRVAELDVLRYDEGTLLVWAQKRAGMAARSGFLNREDVYNGHGLPIVNKFLLFALTIPAEYRFVSFVSVFFSGAR